jgi:lipopolysaccharide export system permease protein
VATVPSVRAAPLVPTQFGFRLPILDSYILRELAGPFAFSLIAFLLFWIVNIFFLAAEYIINAHASPLLLLRFLIFRVPQSTPYAFPFACLFGTLLAFGRLEGDNEITALRTSGVPFLRICATPLLLGVAMFGISYYINDTVAPKAVELSTRTFYQIVYHTAELPIMPQFFRKDDATGNVFYVGNVELDHRTMDDVMIFEQATNSPFRRVINAERATVVGQTLRLTDARVTEFKATGEYNGGVQSKSVDIALPLGETVDQFLNTAQNDAYTMNSKQLSGQINAMQNTGQGGQALDILKITLAQKLAFPFASTIAVIIALPLAAIFGKKGRTLGIALSILVLGGYYLVMAAFSALGKSEALNPYLAAWFPNLILGVAGVILFRRVES